MKFTFLLSVILLTTASFTHAPEFSKWNSQSSEIPAKTVFIKHPAAEDVNRYFSEASMFQLEIYKSGSKEELQKTLNVLRSDKAVESVNEGVVTGDFQAVVISLKKSQNKAWFISWLKSAGLKTIKINNKPLTEIDKL